MKCTAKEHSEVTIVLLDVASDHDALPARDTYRNDGSHTVRC